MKLQAKSKLSIDDLIAQGYCRVSNKHLTVARIDRADWKAFMARERAPWDSAGEGMDWVEALHKHRQAADHYRRCYSKDKVLFDRKQYADFKRFPGSSDISAQQEFVGADRRFQAAVPAVSDASDMEEMAVNSSLAGYVAGEHGARPEDNPHPLGVLYLALEKGRQQALEDESVEYPDAHREVNSNLKATAWLFAAVIILLAVYGVWERIA